MRPPNDKHASHPARRSYFHIISLRLSQNPSPPQEPGQNGGPLNIWGLSATGSAAKVCIASKSTCVSQCTEMCPRWQDAPPKRQTCLTPGSEKLLSYYIPETISKPPPPPQEPGQNGGPLNIWGLSATGSAAKVCIASKSTCVSECTEMRPQWQDAPPKRPTCLTPGLEKLLSHYIP